jgi:hypothetical protein
LKEKRIPDYKVEAVNLYFFMSLKTKVDVMKSETRHLQQDEKVEG